MTRQAIRIAFCAALAVAALLGSAGAADEKKDAPAKEDAYRRAAEKVVDTIEVEGTTDVPNFSLTTAGHPMHLQTRFAATVDGTNGNTDLHPVHATLGKSTFDVSGSIERGALETHKEIDLKASAGKTGLEDFLRLAVKSRHQAFRHELTGRLSVFG